MELTLDQALQKGIEAHKAGKAQEADRYYTAILKANPEHPDANHNMGVLAVGVGKVEKAIPFFKAALEANPSIAQFWLSYIDALIKLDRIEEAKSVLDQAKSKGAKGDGFDKIGIRIASYNSQKLKVQEPPQHQLQALINLCMQGQHQEALTKASQLLKQFSHSIALLNVIGVANQSAGKYEEAIEAYTKAIAVKPDFAEAYYNIGIALNDQGKLNKAIEAYKKAILIKPDFADACYNMSNTLKDQGKLNESIEAYKKTLSIKPDFAEAFNNMGLALKEQGKLNEAIEAYNKAVLIKPNYAGAHNNIGSALQGIIFTKPNKDMQKTIVSLLNREKYIRPKNIAKAAISLLKCEPNLQKYLQPIDNVSIQNPVEVISDLIEFPLLLKLMSICPLPDLELERLLTKLRRSILSNISSLKEASSEFLQFQSALALQCFTNEYIYNNTNEEKKAQSGLEKTVKNALKNNEQPTPQTILVLASYKPLNRYEWCNLLIVNDDIQDVFTRQVEEPNYEKKLKQDLTILEEVTDSISSKVKAQYEESPYPRWVNLGLPSKPLDIPSVIDQSRLKLHEDKITKVKNPKILIAGCGTGQHSIGTAARFKASKVLAIDLSLSSLAYAKRKTEELAVENLDYMQADILDLAKLNKQFDIIESSGVLHHMGNPMAGWKVLTDCLKSGGLMKIGLYSELGRQHVKEIRQEISQGGIRSSDAALKAFRKTVMTSDRKHYKRIYASHDFYSMSTFRDLLFHVHENSFTIPEIKNSLTKLGLKFCGFEAVEIVSRFQQTNKDKNDPYDLDKWQAYEEINPETFTRMYQFWCQKVS